MAIINYKTTVNISQHTMYLKMSGILPDAMQDRHIRVQAVFTQRGTQRRFPMEVELDREVGRDEMHDVFLATAKIRLPYVFRVPPKHDVTLTYSLWYGAEEHMLEDQPFPVNREQFSVRDREKRKSRFRYGLYTVCLPFLLLKNYYACGKNMEEAKKKVNAIVYRGSGYSYSPRQKNTDYFAETYQKEVLRNPEVNGRQVLFLSERLPEEGGNLMKLRDVFRKDPDIEVEEFIHIKTVDQLKKKELAECARKCARAKVIILEDFYPQLHSIRERNETRIVQLWHACGAFKTFGHTRADKKGAAPQSSMNHRSYDMVPVSSSAICNIYAEAFAVNPANVLPLGVPRTDDLFLSEERKERKKAVLYGKYPEMKGRRVVLFAPTFRGDGNRDAYYPEEAFDVNRFMEKMPEDVFLIIRHHPFVHQKTNVEGRFRKRVADLTGKDHINDLMLISDLMITDYSSSIFEAAILGLPMLFYAFDEEEYIGSRDFYFGYRSFVPGPVTADQESLETETLKMLSGENSCREETLEIFKKDYLDAIDGQSTKRVAEYIKNTYLTAK